MEGTERAPRTSRLFVGQLVLDDGRVEKIRIRNISRGGFGARSETPLRQGQSAHMILAGVGLVSGRIVWVRQQDFGLQFDTEIDPQAARVAAPPQAARSEFEVLPQFRPTTDFRRPGFRVRSGG